MTDDRWIVIPNWNKFQHYKSRRPVWIKNYTELLHKREYMDLTDGARAMLHIIWLAYAEADGRLSVKELRGTLTARGWGVLRRFVEQLESLNDAGFIVLLASPELEREKERALAKTDNFKIPDLLKDMSR